MRLECVELDAGTHERRPASRGNGREAGVRGMNVTVVALLVCGNCTVPAIGRALWRSSLFEAIPLKVVLGHSLDLLIDTAVAERCDLRFFEKKKNKTKL